MASQQPAISDAEPVTVPSPIFEAYRARTPNRAALYAQVKAVN